MIINKPSVYLQEDSEDLQELIDELENGSPNSGWRGYRGLGGDVSPLPQSKNGDENV